MADKVFNFEDQRRIGDIGESDFLKVYEKMKPVKSLDDFRIDFTLKDGKTVELKTDSYDMGKTPNFFMEKSTVSGEKTTSGGPWRSKEHKIDYFVYYFVKNKVFFWFRPKELVKILDKLIAKNKMREMTIKNKNTRGGYYEARGYKISRESVEPVLLKEHKVE